ncbi:hypothetical protein J2X36_003572 [Methylobacterium sp. BE186]|nr:hypothetical protein [Methylobacterium sp. BE186]
MEAAGLPEGLQRRLREFAVELWEAARADPAAELVTERAALEARERATEEVLDEALARLDVAEAEMGRLWERLARLEEAAPLASGVAAMT